MMKLHHRFICANLLVLIGSCGIVALMAQEKTEDQKPKSQITRHSKEAKVDARSLVEALANHNPPPSFKEPDLQPIFDKKFALAESNRVWKAIPVFISHAEEAWPELIKHLDDKRYCITIQSMDGSIYNLTVGKVCREIVGRSLSEAYYRNLRPEMRVIYGRLRWPEIAHDPKKLKLWCQERSKKKLYELQIEMCEWAIPEVKNADFRDTRVTTQKRREWVKGIQAEIKSLRESKKAVPFKGFGPEEIMLYPPDEAGKGRKERQNQKDSASESTEPLKLG
jgi:hypothetical protein